MLLAIDPDSTAHQIGQWAGAPVLMVVGLLLVVSARRAVRRSDGSGRGRRFVGTVLIVVGALSLVGTIASAVREAVDDSAERRKGFTSKSGSTIVNTAIRQMQDHVTSVRIKGSAPTPTGRYTYDTIFDTDGRCQTRLKEGKVLQTFIFDGQNAYVKANVAGWRSLLGPDNWRSLLGSDKLRRDEIDLLESKWLLFERNDLVEGLAPDEKSDRFCDFDRLFDSMDGSTDNDNLVTGPEKQIGQARAIEVTDESNKPSSLSFWVETDEPHHILRLDVRQGGRSRDTSFSEFNKPRKNFEPSESETKDVR